LLVERGLAPSRERAQALILAGRVWSDERRVEKAGDTLGPDAPLELRGGADHPYVSRGGVKLAGALEAFAVDPQGRVCADIGASTGGFTDVLLQRGAKKVYAIDVGYGQLHEKLRGDARVVVMERTNARHLKEGSLPEAIELVVIDASFIGLEKILPAAVAIGTPRVEIVALVKPQFEAGKGATKKGVVKDESVRAAAIQKVADAAAALGLQELARADSALPGPEGNVEAFLHLSPRARKPSPNSGVV
jgi:23S rRNA (cytidine1920-2'-O)/16S rRNA (cytidine1409-2'-O)-methyltransferase